MTVNPREKAAMDARIAALEAQVAALAAKLAEIDAVWPQIVGVSNGAA